MTDDLSDAMAEGENATIGSNVSIGEGTVIGSNVVIHDDTHIGNNVRIDDNAVIGKLPMKGVLSATTDSQDLTPCTVCDGCIIGTSTVLYRGCTIGNECLIADMASVRENVQIGEKTIIGKGCTIENKVKIGARCKIQANVQIVPYSVIEDDVFIAPGVMTSNDRYAGRTRKRFDAYKGITIKKGARIGVAAVTLPGVVVHEDALVGAGALVTKDVPARKVVAGVPARVIKDVPEEELLENQE